MNVFRSIVLLLLLSPLGLLGQPKTHIEHFGLEEGLPQRTIMDIMQDSKGFMWLATWDGICKFDGYNFTSFKTAPNDTIVMNTSRVDKIAEDSYGYIWLTNYNKEAFRFDPATEKYVASFRVNNRAFKTSEIQPKPSGKVWLLSGSMGAICVLDSLNTRRQLSVAQKSLPDNKVNTVFEDVSGLSWVLTDNGLVRFSPSVSKDNTYRVFFSGKDKLSQGAHFLSATETDKAILFGANNGRIFIYDKSIETFSSFNTGVRSDIISIKKAYNNLFVILTGNDGFFICDANMRTIKKVDKVAYKALPTNEMLSCYPDRNNNIWLETNSKGIAKYNLFEDKLSFYTPNDYGNNAAFFPSFFIMEDKLGNIWAHPHGGFSFYDAKLDKMVPFFNNPRSPEWKFSDILHYACMDKQGNIWLSTRSGGLEKIVIENSLFKQNDFYSSNISVTGYEVRSILEDANHNIWLGNLGGIISVYDSNRNLKGFVCEDGTVSKSGKRLKAMTYSLMQDRKGNIWAGTKGNGVYLLKPRNNSFESFEIVHYKNIPGDKYSLSNDLIYSIHEDDKGRIWLGSFGGGINLFDAVNKRFFNQNNLFKHYPVEAGARVRTVRSFNNKLYAGTTAGLVVLSVSDKEPGILGYKVFTKATGDIMNANDVQNICITGNKDLYIGTFGGGMSKIVSWDKDGFPEKSKIYGKKDGLCSDIVLSIAEDNCGHLWINSEGRLSRFNPASEKCERFNDVSKGSSQYFMETLPLLTSDGELIYGYSAGTLSFWPGKIVKNNYTPYLALVKLKVSNNDYTLNTKVDDIKELVLKHKENIFSIEYAALDYSGAHGISYAYKLEGFDEDWVISQQRIANYTNIPPGDYIFKVKSTNSSGTWIDNERSLLITIKPSIWQTKWAYLSYFLLGALLLYVVLRSIFIYYRLKERILLEEAQTEMRSRFFTEISHEIRTPLTMVVAPLENILQNEKTHAAIRPQLQLVMTNANRMLKMVNQILDFRKIQKQRLQIKEIPVGGYVEEVCNTAFKLTEDQGIHLAVNNQLGTDTIWVDPEAIEKLLYNLVSNSIKHTPKGKKIEVNVFRKDKSVALQVKDQGEGMSKEILNKLFARFVSYNKDKSKPSTGIGLSIVKEIVDKHHAKIVVESDENKGSTITVLFQPGREHFSRDANIDIISASVKPAEDDMTVVEGAAMITEKPAEDCILKQLSILVVEDDPDLRDFIKSVLTDEYQVYEAKNGREGYEKAKLFMPDIILSDLMMPEMDGIAFLQKMRSDDNTSHIPFILLTAKTSADDELEGINKGADDYITKPFSLKLLTAKISNILRQRKNLAAHLLKGASHEPEDVVVKELPAHGNITEQDELFLKQLRQDILDNIDRSEFAIDDLARKANLSRRLFFSKVKSLSGLAPVEFVREVRLNYAAELIRTQQYRIKEVVYMVGFSDVRYFAQCFKKTFGMTPMQYRENAKEC
ncbi:hybrid sensor histidine kinase/response regulator transcription factor [Filimonas effusa]|uniref:histidine kinase n=1 Tax=Filimonas effusa TaxID=2508721 RepID=A0A4Q1D9P5_9BACT|nr:two-component regulator propeller domain-containing protein [Filimonas effusa]RXK86081.1 hybrid sensor histidine kinase/response regulator [Filimonas effusa]